MYENPGKSMQKIAKTVAVAIMVIMVICGLIVAFSENFIAGIIAIAGGVLTAWLSGLGLAALGRLVENSDRQVELLKSIEERMKNS